MSHYLSGLPAWLVQRLSALYLTLFTLAAFVWWLTTPQLDYAGWRTLFASMPGGIVITLAFIALLLHCWVGVRDVILDYAGQHAGLRLVLLSLLGGGVLAMAVWMVRILAHGVLA